VSWIGEIGLRALIEFKQRASRNGTPPACPESLEGYFRWQFDTSAALFRNYPGFDVSGKSVLEIGCGTGGRSAYLAHQGAARVVGGWYHQDATHTGLLPWVQVLFSEETILNVIRWIVHSGIVVRLRK
jgi:2-polyprenyl-3-methyl-5-hydroxy-6-metoxy-1,4-benzoquinol methylase